MKRTAILINTARGGPIDQDALAAALAEGAIACAGLDVFEQEPLPTDSPLADLDNVILSNHMAWYTEESSVELVRDTVGIVAVLRCEQVCSVIGHDAGAGVAAWCALIRPDVFPVGGPDERAVHRAAGPAPGPARPAAHGRPAGAVGGVESAAQALPGGCILSVW